MDAERRILLRLSFHVALGGRYALHDRNVPKNELANGGAKNAPIRFVALTTSPRYVVRDVRFSDPPWKECSSRAEYPSGPGELGLASFAKRRQRLLSGVDRPVAVGKARQLITKGGVDIALDPRFLVAS